ncbi:YbaB/EbfC family nucleoid-associated protein [Nocardia miyunensis]|uniref:YbaB/EbfC family nucleoid-associated protein n=1 Tax=Nocardia miyunensis TaxID=282684 RepID=UPI0008318FBE|nr:YbaB/EbfC family nucleoid-associated protein [Nocardia miyunensis]
MSDSTEIDTTLAEIRAKADRVRAAMAKIRGVGRAGNGTIFATVDAAGRLRDLHLPRDVSRLGPRLADLILEATTAAERDAAKQAAAATQPLTGDPRVRTGIEAVRETITGTPRPAKTKPMTEQEIQAADDAYFERMNRTGWRQ